MEAWRSSWRKRFEAAAIAGLGYPVLRLLGATLRWKVEGSEHLSAIYASGRFPVTSFWHGRILAALLHFEGHKATVLISENFDGEWIARIARRFGYDAARGSTTRGSRKAALQLVRTMKQGTAAAITVDGPRGPARVAQPGAIWLAMATGNPVLPFHAEASSHWTLRSWDQTQIPKPFSTMSVVIAPPIEVARDADAGSLEEARLLLEQRLAEAEQRARVNLG